MFVTSVTARELAAKRRYGSNNANGVISARSLLLC